MSWIVAAVSWYDGATLTLELTSQTAVWYRAGNPPVHIRWVLIRDPESTFDPQALLCTDPAADPTRILKWFVLRWQLEVTLYQVRGRLFREVRAHLGVETQRQSSDLAIARTTPRSAGALLLDHPDRPRPATRASHHPAHRSLVRQTVAYFRGCHRLGATPPVAGVGRFLTVSL